MESPSDNTAVFRMKQEFNKFLVGSNTSQRPDGKRLTFSESLLDASGGAGASYVCTPSIRRRAENSSICEKDLKEREKEEKQRQVDLITAKSKIAQLESQLSSLDTSRKRARIEYEQTLESTEHRYKSEIEKITDLRHQLRLMSDREQESRSRLADARRALENTQGNQDSKMIGMQKDNIRMQEQLDENSRDFRAQITELQRTVAQLQADLQSTQAKNMQLTDELQIAQRRISENVSVKQQLEECINVKIELEIKLKEMELSVSRHEVDAVSTNAMKSQLEHLHGIEKENRRLVEENRYNRETRDNILLLREQNEGLVKKLERAEDRCSKFSKLQVEHEELAKKLSRWEILGDDGISKPRSPSAITKRVADLQASNAALLEKQGTLQASTHALEENIRRRDFEMLSLKERLVKEESKSGSQGDFVKRLQRKLLLVTKERDGYKGIIDSYESEVTMSVGAAATARTQQLEGTVEGYRRHIAALEAEITLVNEKLTAAASQSHKLEQRLASTVARGPEQLPHVTSEVDQKIIQGLRNQIADLEKTLEDSQRERDILEERIERRHLQGDYDPSKTKVVHFSMNPVAMAQKRQSEELAALKTENEKLTQRIKLLEESGGSMEDMTMKVEAKLQEPSCSKDVESIRSQLSSAELKNKRLTEAFKKTSKEFREMCYQLLGYRVDMKPNNQYKLMNMYAESPEEYLLFQQTKEGEMQLLGTDYSSTLEEKMEHYLQGSNSIPAFLSSITLDLFSQQTMLS